MLPDGSGLRLFQHVRDLQFPVKVIVTTGTIESTLLAAVRQLEPNSLLIKPVDLSRLLQAVDSLDASNRLG